MAIDSQVFNNSSEIAISEAGELFSLYIRSLSSLIKHKNSVHLSASFYPGTSPDDQAESFRGLTADLARLAGLKPGSLSGAAIWLCTEHSDGLTSRHLHAVIRGPKSWRTGKSIARIPQQELASYRMEPSGLAVQSFVIAPIFSLPGLIRYISETNLQNGPGHRIINAEFLPINQKEHNQ